VECERGLARAQRLVITRQGLVVDVEQRDPPAIGEKAFRRGMADAAPRQ